MEDTIIDGQKRWVVISPPGAKECGLLLAKAADEKQFARVGNQTGSSVFLLLCTYDFWRDFTKMTEQEINFIRSPKEEPYGMVAGFEDLYRNLWDLLEPNEKNNSIIRNNYGSNKE